MVQRETHERDHTYAHTKCQRAPGVVAPPWSISRGPLETSATRLSTHMCSHYRLTDASARSPYQHKYIFSRVYAVHLRVRLNLDCLDIHIEFDAQATPTPKGQTKQTHLIPRQPPTLRVARLLVIADLRPAICVSTSRVGARALIATVRLMHSTILKHSTHSFHRRTPCTTNTRPVISRCLRFAHFSAASASARTARAAVITFLHGRWRISGSVTIRHACTYGRIM